MNAKKAAAMISIQADAKGLDRGMSEAKKKLRAFGNDAKKIGAKLWGGAKGTLLGIGAATGIGGALGIASASDDLRAFEKDLLRLQIATKKSGGAMGGLRQDFLDISRSTGIDVTQISAAAREYFDLTSDAEGVTDAMRVFAKVAQATDSSMADVNASAAALRNQLGIMPADMEAVFSAFVEQGNMGQIGIKNLAAELVNLLPVFKKFGVAGKEGAVQLNAAFQVVAKDFGSASTAATGLENMMGMLAARQKQLAAAGVKVFDVKNGVVQMRRLDAIVGDIREKMPDIRKHGAILGENQEARKALNALLAAPGAFDDIVRAGEEAGNAIDRDFRAVAESSVFKMDQAMNNLKLAVLEAFTPDRVRAFAAMVEKVARTVGKTIDALSELADMMGPSKNPFETENLTNEQLVNVVAAQTKGQTYLPDSHPAVRAGQSILDNRASFAATTGDIRGGGDFDTRVARAVQAYFTDEHVTGSAGKRQAARQFLDEQGVSRDRVEEVRYELVAKHMVQQMTRAIQDGFKGVSVKMDSSEVTKAINRAPIHRGGGG